MCFGLVSASWRVVKWGSLPLSIDRINNSTSSLYSLTLPVVPQVEGGKHATSIALSLSFHILICFFP